MHSPLYRKQCSTSLCASVNTRARVSSKILNIIYDPKRLQIIIFTMTLLFCVLMLISYAFEYPATLFVRDCNSMLMPAMRSMSLAKRRLLNCFPPMKTEISRSCKVFHNIFSRKMLNSTRESGQPWRTPTVVENDFPTQLLNRMGLLEPSYRALIFFWIFQ